MAWAIWLAFAACTSKSDLYAACDEARDCSVPDDAEPACLDKSDEGLCTWECSVDADCATDELDLVCASFESDEGLFCFPSCEHDEADCPPRMGCRSTGGGSSNRKVCFPEGL